MGDEATFNAILDAVESGPRRRPKPCRAGHGHTRGPMVDGREVVKEAARDAWPFAAAHLAMTVTDAAIAEAMVRFHPRDLIGCQDAHDLLSR